MSKALIVLPLFIFNSFFGPAQNIICNPGFETHNPVESFPNDIAQAGDRLECWEDDMFSPIGGGGTHYHSPDWFHFNGNQSPFVMAEDIDGSGTFVNILGRNNSDGYLGMRTCELIKQNTWNPGFLNNNGYVISFYVRRPRPNVQVGGSNLQMTSETVYIEVSISKNGPTYVKEQSNCDINPPCDAINYGFGFNLKQVLPTIELDVSALPFGEWVPVSIPYFTADDNYDYFTIQTIPSTAGETCDSYLLFDDFSVQEFEHGLNADCHYFTDPNCADCAATEGSMNVSLVNNILGPTIPLAIEGLENVSSFTYSISSATPQVVQAPKFFSCANGWSSAQELPLVPGLAAGQYNLSIIYSNSCGFCFQNLAFTIPSFYDFGALGCNCRALNVKKECCLNDYFADQYQKICTNSSELKYTAIDNLLFGGNSSFSLQSNDNLIAHASNSITFLSDFEVLPGSEMSAEIFPCDANMMMGSNFPEDSSMENEAHLKSEATKAVKPIHEIEQVVLKVYPNPATDEIISIETSISEVCHLSITNINGQIIFEEEFENSLYLSTKVFKPGIYIVRINAHDKFAVSERFIVL